MLFKFAYNIDALLHFLILGASDERGRAGSLIMNARSLTCEDLLSTDFRANAVGFSVASTVKTETNKQQIIWGGQHHVQ